MTRSKAPVFENRAVFGIEVLPDDVEKHRIDFDRFHFFHRVLQQPGAKARERFADDQDSFWRRMLADEVSGENAVLVVIGKNRRKLAVSEQGKLAVGFPELQVLNSRVPRLHEGEPRNGPPSLLDEPFVPSSGETKGDGQEIEEDQRDADSPHEPRCAMKERNQDESRGAEGRTARRS